MSASEKYIPLPYRDGNKIVDVYIEDFEDRAGNKAKIKKCRFTNKKGKLIEDHVIQVMWEDQKLPEGFTSAFLKAFNGVNEDMEYYDGPLSYYFRLDGKMYFSVIGKSYMEYFVFELPTKIKEGEFKTFNEQGEFLIDSAKSIYKVTYLLNGELRLSFGSRAENSFKIFLK